MSTVEPSHEELVKALQRSPFSDFDVRGAKRFGASQAKRAVSKEREFFERATAAAMLAHMRGKPMDLEAIASEDEGLPVPRLAELMRTPLFRQAMEERGIPLSNEQRLTRKQLDVIRVLSDNSSPLSERERVQGLGVSWNEFQGWLEWKPFSELYDVTSAEALKKAISPARVKLAEAMAKGAPWAVKYGFEMTGEYNPAAQQAQDLQLFMRMVMTVLMKHVTNGEQLLAISRDLELAAERSNVASLEVLPSSDYTVGDTRPHLVELHDNVYDSGADADSGESGNERAVFDGDGERELRGD